MKSISAITKYIRNLIPYFLLIAIYFFFVNLEARNEKNNVKIIQKEKIPKLDKSNIDDNKLRIKIPVIPYNK